MISQLHQNISNHVNATINTNEDIKLRSVSSDRQLNFHKHWQKWSYELTTNHFKEKWVN